MNYQGWVEVYKNQGISLEIMQKFKTSGIVCIELGRISL